METPSRYTFSPDGNTKVFPIPVTIKGENYVRIDVDSVTINDRNRYDIVNNAVVFVNVADVPNGSQLDVLVVQTDEGITNLGAVISVDIVAQNIASVNTVATDIASVNTVAGDIASVVNTSANIASVNTVAGDISSVNTVAGDIASVVNTSANIADVSTVAGSISNVNTVAPSIANVNTVAPDIASVNTVAGDILAVVAVALDESNINTVAGSITHVNTVSANIADVTAAAADIVDIKAAPAAAAAAEQSEINAAGHELVAGIHATNASNSAVAAAVSETNAAASAASAAAALDNFDDRYLGVKTSNPTLDNDGDPLVQGALYFDSTTKKMMVYDGSTWLESSSVAPVSLITYTYTAGASQATYTGADQNAAVLDYTPNNIIVLVNGVAGTVGIDYTASDGTSVNLAIPPTAGSIVDIIAFKSFVAADTVSATNGGTFAGNVTVPQLTATDVVLPSSWSISVSSGDLVFQSSGVDRLTVDTSGNLVAAGLQAELATKLTEPQGDTRYGVRTISTSNPSGGSNGDIWFKVT